MPNVPLIRALGWRLRSDQRSRRGSTVVRKDALSTATKGFIGSALRSMGLWYSGSRFRIGFIPVSPQNTVREGMSAVYPRLWRYTVALTGGRNWGDDLAQTACLRALDKADQFEVGTYLDRRMFRMCQRVRLNEVGTGGGIMPVEEIDLADNSPGTEANILARQVLSNVNARPEAQRQPVLLVCVEGFSDKEAAEKMEIPVGTVTSRLAGVRKKLNTQTRTDERRDMSEPRAISDEKLTAFLDGEADAALAAEISGALETDEALAERVESLPVPMAAIVGAFDELLRSAPPMPEIAPPFPEPADTNARLCWTWGLGTFGTGLAAGLAGGFFAGFCTPTPEPAQRGWVSFVAGYQTL